MYEFKKTWLPRIIIGGLLADCLFLLLLSVADASPTLGGGWSFRSPFTVLFQYFDWPSVNLVLVFLLGAEAGVATIPFADSGRELVVRSVLHYAVTTATMTVWVLLLFPNEPNCLPTFLVPLTLVYFLVWLGRWVGWYMEVAAIRERLGLSPGPSLLKWRESLPYFGYAFLLCLALPLLLRALDDHVPVLSVMYAGLLLPIGGFMSGLSLGKRQGFCPLYPAVCGVCILIFIPLARLCSNMADEKLIPAAVIAGLLGNLTGTVIRRRKARRSV